MSTTTPPPTGAASPPLPETVRTNIRLELARRSMANPQLAAAMNVKPFWVTRRLNATIAISLDDLQMIATGLETDVATLVTPRSEP